MARIFNFVLVLLVLLLISFVAILIKVYESTFDNFESKIRKKDEEILKLHSIIDKMKKDRTKEIDINDWK